MKSELLEDKRALHGNAEEKPPWFREGTAEVLCWEHLNWEHLIGII